VRRIDEGLPVIENILLTIVTVLVLVYLFVALIRPEVFQLCLPG
jgi:K+-transporting ATPase KdpF subunit